MNTTESYVNGLKPYDALNFKSQRIKEIEIFILKEGKRKVISNRYLNEHGRIYKILEIASKWTAYPPSSDGSIPKLPEDEIEEISYIYLQNGYLQRIESRQLGNDEVLKSSDVSYSNGHISSINSNRVKKIFYRSDDGSILKTEMHTHINQKLKYLWTEEFLRDEENRVVERQIKETRVNQIDSDDNPEMRIICSHKYSYNSNDQLISSVKTILHLTDISVPDVITNFEYLDKDLDLIKSMMHSTPDKVTGNIEFVYNNKNQLVGQNTTNLIKDFITLKEFKLT